MRFVSYKEQKAVMTDLKKGYQALTLEDAELAFSQFKEKWSKKHPIIIKSWEANWLELTAYFSYLAEIRRLIYTINTIEGYYRQLRKVTKTKTAYPIDDALRKIIYRLPWKYQRNGLCQLGVGQNVYRSLSFCMGKGLKHICKIDAIRLDAGFTWSLYGHDGSD